MRLIFMGTPDFAVPTLAEIADAHEVVAVYTRAPRPAGRGMAARITSVNALADRLGLPVFTPKTLRSEDAAAAIEAHAADAAVVAAYGLILPKAILDAPALGCLNLHASLLPRWRGAAPIQRAVMAGDRETGVCVMRMEDGLDTGPVAMAERTPIPVEATAGEMHDRLARLGAGLMGRALAALSRGALIFTPQPETGVIYAKKIANDEAHIDWSRPAAEVHNLIRGLSPFPGAFFEADFGRGRERVKVLRSSLVHGGGTPGAIMGHGFTVACGEDAVRLLQVQRAGKGPMSADDFLRGVRLAPGTVLA